MFSTHLSYTLSHNSESEDINSIVAMHNEQDGFEPDDYRYMYVKMNKISNIINIFQKQ